MPHLKFTRIPLEQIGIYAISSKISMERWEICIMYCVNYYESPPVLKVGLSKTQVKQVKVKNITFIRKGLEID